MSERDSLTPEELQQTMFAHLVISLAGSTMQALGKIMNPATKKTEVNLEAAQATIDMLDMLQAKTRGNLNSDEMRMLNDTLTELKLNFVETANATPAPAPAPAADVKPTSDTSKPKGDGEKFHKSYG